MIKTKQRLICVNGYYSILNSVAVLRQKNDKDIFENNLLISVDKLDKDSLYNFASQFKDFDNIIITLYERKKGGYSNLKSNFSKSYFDEIMIPFGGTYKYLLKQGFDAEKVIIYDEGMETYFDITRIAPFRKKITETYLTDTSLLWKNNDFKNNNINITILNKILSELKENIILKENSIIFLSSVSSSKNKKLNSYSNKDIEIINLLLSKGYNVYYKAHPRNYLKNNSNLISLINNDNFFIIDQTKNYLIETIVFNNKNKIKFLVGEESSVLYQSYKIFGIPSFSIFPKIFTNIKQIKILQHLPRLEDFINSNLSPSEFYLKEMEILKKNRERFNLLQNMLFSSTNNEIMLKKQIKFLKLAIIILLILLVIFICI